MASHLKITYLPLFDLIIFLIALLALAIAYFVSSINFWLITASATFSYLVTIAKAWIIKLNEDKLKVISLNPFFRSHSIDIKSIIKISSSESFDYDTVVTAEVYPIFNKNYEIEYLDKNGRKKSVMFSINNKNKEQKILEALKTLSANQGI